MVDIPVGTAFLALLLAALLTSFLTTVVDLRGVKDPPKTLVQLSKEHKRRMRGLYQNSACAHEVVQYGERRNLRLREIGYRWCWWVFIVLGAVYLGLAA